ncbi:MAG TPA: hypothetical protein VGC72_09460 [Candidatus Elarobacter sp.]|jgi:hypothetical protein
MPKPTADDWHLFSVSPDGAITQAAVDRAVAALSTALDQAEAAVRGGVDAYEAYDIYVEPVSEEHEDVGAADSEPRDAAIEYLLEISGGDG